MEDWQELLVGRNNVLFDYGKYDLEEFELIGDRGIRIAVPPETPVELKKNILAGAKAYYGGYKSIDYVLKTYGEYWDLEEDEDVEKSIYRKLVQEAKSHVRVEIDKVKEIQNKPSLLGLFAAVIGLSRLAASFKSAGVLIFRGHNLEAMAICRLILEQIAWALAVHGLEEDDDVLKMKPTRAISGLKNLIKEAGSDYGFLSNRMHLNARSLFVNYTFPALDGVYVRQNDPEESLKTAYILLTLSDYYCVVSEYITRDLPREFKFILVENSNRIKLDPSRPTAKLLEEHDQKVWGA